MAGIGKLNVQIGVDLNKFRADMNGAFKTLNSSTAQMKRSLKGLEGDFRSLNNTIGFVTRGLAGIAVLKLGKDILYAADAFNQLQAKIRNSVDATTSVQQVFNQIVASSNRTGTSVSAVAQAFARIRPAALELGITNTQLIQFNETFQKMGTLAGASTLELQQTMIQLSQAIASNRLGGDELRSVLEQMPPVARAIADAMKVPMSELKGLAKEGKITADIVMDAVLSKTKEVDEAFSNLPPSVERSMNRVTNELQLLLGAINENIDATGNFAEMLDELAGFLQQNQEEIVAVTKFIAQMGETAVQMGSVVVNGIGVAVNAVGAGITGLVGMVMQAIENMVNQSIQGINTIISLMNKIPGVNVGSVGGFRAPGHNFIDRLGGLFGQDLGVTAGRVGSTISDIFSGKSVFNRRGGGMGMGTSSLTKSQFSGMGGGGGKKRGGGGRGKKGGGGSLSSADRFGMKDTDLGLDIMGSMMEGAKDSGVFFESMSEAKLKLFERFKSLTEGMKTPLEQFQEKMRDLNAAFALGVAEPAQYQEALKRLNETMQDDSAIELRDLSEEAKKALDAQKQVLEDIRGPQLHYQESVAAINQLLSQNKITQEEATQALKDAQTELDGAKNKGNEWATAVGNVVSQFGDKFFDTFTRGLKDGKFAFKDFVASALEDLAKLIFKLTVTIPLATALSGAFSGGGSGGSGWHAPMAAPKKSNFMGGLFSMGGNILKSILPFAEGGNFSAGQPMMVGEQGPELMMPRHGGTVIPNNALGGGGVVLNQYFTLNTNDSKSFQDQLAGQARFIGNMSVQAVQRQQNRMGNRGVMER